MQNKLDSYKGRLTAAQIAEGMNAANQNARRLVEDAQLLLDAVRYPTAVALAALAIEEAGKCSILRALAWAKDDADVSRAWRDFRSHTRKNAAWPLPDLHAAGARRLKDFRPLFIEGAEHPFLLDQLKQLSIYTDCLGRAHWSMPVEVIDEKLARRLVAIAAFHVASRTVHTEHEIDLWIRRFTGVDRAEFAAMKAALVGWYSDMQASGLKPGGENKIETFVTVGVTPASA